MDEEMSKKMTSVEDTFRCPVCRANQPLRPQCRRCRTDLSLVVRARQRLAYLLEQRSNAVRDGDLDGMKIIQRELMLLAPGHAVDTAAKL